MGTKVVTGEVRAAYVNVFSPRLNELSGQEEYSMSILIPKTDKKTLTELEIAVDEAKKKKWPAKAPVNLRLPLRDGDAEKPDNPDFAGHYWINLKAKVQPGIIDAMKNKLDNEMDFISGDYCRCSINAYAYSMKGNSGVAFGLNNIQVLRRGPSMSARSRAEDDFDVYDSGGQYDLPF